MEEPVTMPRYAPNVPDVAFESFDDEVVLIHFPSGRYYRLDLVGLAVWNALEVPGGASPDQISDTLAARFEGGSEVISKAVDTFIAGLVENELVVHAAAVEDQAVAEEPAARPAVMPSDEPKQVFVPPEFQVFTDLEDILLLDPIHDVDETGWPHANA